MGPEPSGELVDFVELFGGEIYSVGSIFRSEEIPMLGAGSGMQFIVDFGLFVYLLDDLDYIPEIIAREALRIEPFLKAIVEVDVDVVESQSMPPALLEFAQLVKDGIIYFQRVDSSDAFVSGDIGIFEVIGKVTLLVIWRLFLDLG